MKRRRALASELREAEAQASSPRKTRGPSLRFWALAIALLTSLILWALIIAGAEMAWRAIFGAQHA
jgi:hypothetical protein